MPRSAEDSDTTAPRERRAPTPDRGRPAALLLGCGFAVFAAAFAWGAAQRIEASAAARIERAATAAGWDWLDVSMDGLTATLSGAAPDAEVAAMATATARGAGFVRVRDAMERVPPPPPAPPEVGLELLRDVDGGVTVLGVAPTAAALDRLLEALARAHAAGVDGAPDHADADGDGPRWRLIESAALAGVEALSVGRVSLAPGAFSVTGLPASEAARIALERAGRALEAGGVAVALDLSAPAAGTGVALLDVEKTAGGVAVRACDPVGGAGLSTALGALGADVAACGEGALSADADWAAAAAAGLAALKRAPIGRFRLEGRAATLSLRDAGEGQAQAAFARHAAALPDGYTLAALGPEGGRPAPAPVGGQPWLRVRLTPELALVTGAAPDLATRSALVSYAAAAFGAGRVHDGMALVEAGAADGWRAASLAAMDALAAVGEGAVEVAAGGVVLKGTAREALAAVDAHTALAAAEERGWTASSSVVIDLPARAAEALLGPVTCAAELSAAAQASPILFEPASSEIEGESVEVLDAMALILRRCAAGGIEIGGHTDSQGSAGYNLALSQARAEAVRAALIVRGAQGRMLTARGYGPAEPVASNATEEGRALNRRIAFTALTPEPAEATASSENDLTLADDAPSDGVDAAVQGPQRANAAADVPPPPPRPTQEAQP